MMRDIFRYVLYVVVAAFAVLLVQAWQHDYPQPKEKTITVAQQEAAVTGSMTTTPSTNTKATLGGYVPSTVTETKVSSEHSQSMHLLNKKRVISEAVRNARFVWVKTDLLQLAINLNGGNVVDAQLLKYPVSLQEKNTPITLFSAIPNQLYKAQSGLSSGKTIQFQAAKTQYTLQSGQKELQVVLTGKTADGLSITKTYTFKPNNYAIGMNMEVKNEGSKAWKGALYTQLVRRQPEKNAQGMFGLHSFNGAAVSSPETPYKKLSYKEMSKANLDQSNPGGWVAMQQHYFLSAWIPETIKQENHFYTHEIASTSKLNPVFVIGFLSPNMTINPGSTANTSATLYVGPEEIKRLAALAPGLDHTLDFGFLYPISIAIHFIMVWIVKVIPNWGVAIIITTILIKILFYWFSAKSFISMAKMRELQPQIKGLQERYADDKQALQKATMSLYKEKKVNPVGGCLPMLIQIPVFIALYYVITQSVSFRQAPFVFWIHDLSVKDPYYVLPLLMFCTMALQQWLSPTSADPMQAKMMWIMPVVFSFLFRNFPAGLVLYWCVNNLVQALQQWYVSKRYAQGKYRHLEKKKKKRATPAYKRR